MSVQLSESLLSKAAGWDAIKQARAYLAQGQVLSSHWGPPLLRGVVQSGGMSFRASLVIKTEIDIENLCTCREAREWGKICAHSVAVGLHWLKAQQAPAPVESADTRTTEARKTPIHRPSAIARSETGEPVELQITLPPDIEQAVARGKIMVVLEAQWNGGRCPLNALPKNRSFAFNHADALLLDQIEKLAGGETPAVLQLGLKDFASLLPAMVDHPNIRSGRTAAVSVRRESAAPAIRAVLDAHGEITLNLKNTQNLSCRVENWVWQNKEFRPSGFHGILAGLSEGTARISRTQVPQFLSQEWPRLKAQASVEANFAPEDFDFEPQAPEFSLELRGGLARLEALLQCAYGRRVMTIGVTGSEELAWLPDPNNPKRYSCRDVTSERAALGRLQRAGFSGPDSNGKLQLLGQDPVLNFFARDYPKLQREWTVSLDERLQKTTAEKFERIDPRFQITSSGVEWFDLGVVFASREGQTFPPAEIQRLLLSGQNHTRLRNGKVAMLDVEAVEEFQQALRDCSPEQRGQVYRINSQQEGFLSATLQQHPDWRVTAPTNWLERTSAQTGKATLPCPHLNELDAVLRPYQKDGVAWLLFLRGNQFGGILADEMGLGKTLQTLAFLQHVRRTVPGLVPALVICPTSLVYNWAAEAARFAPALKVLAIQGSNRQELFEQIPRHDLVITSYALVRRDAEHYLKWLFDTVVLDEAQHIKNRQTQNAQAVKAIKADHRLVLTGTPLENSVLDLWSIFDFLMPGYLGTAQDFRERYEQPIARDKNSATQARLARRLRPFLLRRLKTEVASDLPKKLEQISFCEMTREQRGAYQQILEASRKEILDSAGSQGMTRSRMLVLTTLLRLRQVCCDLRLLQLQNTDAASSSGKLDLFNELLEEIIDGGHRVLVFSQFVGMLKLIQDRLRQEEIEFCYLDGTTTQRGAVVERFQSDSSIPVFLISLKAGGVGLNLTGADTVIHFDPWWNPAVEAQATDRAHRIGQTQVVTSYKLITRETVEEKILKLQNRKRELIQATIAGEEEFASSLSWEEIQELLA